MVSLVACSGQDDGPSEAPRATPSLTAASPTDQQPGDRAIRVSSADGGRTVAMRVGQVGTLVVRDPTAPEPRVVGGCLVLVPRADFAGTGSRQWEVRAASRGACVVTASERGRRFSVTFDVR